MACAAIPGPHAPGRDRRRARAAWCAGVALGLAALAGVIAVARVPGEGAGPVAAVAVRVSPSGEVAAGTTAPVLRAAALAPGAPAAVDGGTTIRNTTGSPIVVGVRASADSDDLDAALRLQVSVEGIPVADGSLAALRAGAPRRVLLAPGRTAALRVRAWLDPARAPEAGGRGADVTIGFTATAAPR